MITVLMELAYQLFDISKLAVGFGMGLLLGQYLVNHLLGG